MNLVLVGAAGAFVGLVTERVYIYICFRGKKCCILWTRTMDATKKPATLIFVNLCEVGRVQVGALSCLRSTKSAKTLPFDIKSTVSCCITKFD